MLKYYLAIVKTKEIIRMEEERNTHWKTISRKIKEEENVKKAEG